MRLKSLELFGFKSFAERTVFDFDEGVTAIVGPNGCGKSNTVDAVKWVLGEQRAKSLRGQSMTDVIFNGSSNRAALDLAEVTLRFDNEDRSLPMDADQVDVTRRLYRSGDSEYLINGQSSRLKDVRELFMGTGLGPGGYSFMEQGKIDSVLASNPIDRRKVFEEAAGISRFRSRRHETELKLDKVEANLLRLADILEELTRQERSLKIQAGKAERYQEHSRRARELQAQVALYRYDSAASRREELAKEVAELGDHKGGKVERQTEIKARLAEVDQELARVSEGLAVARERAADIGAREKAARDLAGFHRRHLENLEEREKARRAAIEELEADLGQGAEDRERVAREKAELEANLGAMKTALTTAEGSVRELRERMNRVEGDVKKAAESVDSLVRRQADLDRQHARIEADERRWADEVERSDEGLAERQREKDQLETHRVELGQRLEAANEKLVAGRAEVARLRARREELDARSASLGEENNRLLNERSKVVGRIDALEGHISRQEGLDEGVKSVLAERKKRADFLPGFRGLLIDLFQADLELADAFEAALGELAQAIVVTTVAEALEGAAFLGEGGRGRAAFLALEAFPTAGAALPAGVSAGDEAGQRVLATLLGGLDVVEPEAIAARIERGLSTGSLLVTTGGALVRDGRIFVTGSKKGRRGQVAVRSELERLRGQREDLKVRLEELAGEIEALRLEREGLKTEYRETEARVQADESTKRGLDHESEAIAKQLDRLQLEFQRLGTRRAEAAKRIAELEVEKERNKSALDEVTGLVDRARDDRSRSSDDRDQIRAELDEAVQVLERERVGMATASQRLHGLASSLEHLETRRSDAERAIARYREELSTFAGDRERTAASVGDEEKKAEELEKELSGSRESIGGLEEQVGTVRRQHQDLARQLADVEQDLGELADKLHKLDVRENELRVTMEGLVEHVHDELELDLVALHRDYVPAENVDWKAIEAELEERRAMLRKLGNVNLQAIDDLREVEERLEFLVAQRNDLQHSKQLLVRILRDIEAESTRLFVETFERVREHFQVMFRKLFGGGRADITLVEPENVLESGIEITARPPGKEARSITLLSGGERTLTAVALLFSIIRAHPCPCCLMDEVDAALDEDNTERFCLLLDEFLDRTQFILITHSRRTMARADVLFGVTMGERGVSRHVGVRFEDVADDGSFVERSGAEAEQKRGARERRARAQGKAREEIDDTGEPGDEEGHRGPARGAEQDGSTGGDGEVNGNGHGKGKGNGNGKAKAAGERLVASELLVDLNVAAEAQDPGGRTAEAAE
ncbi:MAG: chromosome segregation protein SMC [Planctomycetes bacterium]|nr:chromosome segregation protein SMC [Planctomycetota bacterium]